MEVIPEIVESNLSFIITRRYHGMFEVGISYMGSYIKRYPIITLTERFLLYLIANFPILGLWIFSKAKRASTLQSAYNKAIDQFIESIKLDIANEMFEITTPKKLFMISRRRWGLGPVPLLM
jgi:hypothetical protein